MSGDVVAGMDCRNSKLGGLAKELSGDESEWRCQMSLVRWKVFSVAVFVAISTMTLSAVKAQDAQPMNEVTLGSGSASGSGVISSGDSLSGANGDSVAVIDS